MKRSPSPKTKKDKDRTPSAPPQNAPTLREIQDRFQAAILEGGDGIFEILLDNSRTTRATLFGVYQHAYASRLIDILQGEYEILAAYCGEEHFETLARAYIAACPSHTQNARWFGSRLPGFLTSAEMYAKRPQLAEIARIEKALSDAFDATDAPVLDAAGLTRYPPEKWGSLSFAPHPSATRLDLTTNAFAIWKALKNGETPPKSALVPAIEHLIVWRQATAPVIRAMGAEETMMWTEACRGVRFEVLCEMVATFDDPDNAALRAAGHLQGWLTTHLLTSASLVQRPKRKSHAPVESTPRKTARRPAKSQPGA